MLKFDPGAEMHPDLGPPQCHFGILEVGAGLLASVSAGIGSGAAALGAGAAAADAIGTGVTGALVGGGLGAGEAAITGGNIGTGALTGGITGGAIGGLGGAIGSATGLGSTAGDAIAGAGAGAAGSAVTGGNALTGALTGGASGLAAGALGGLSGDGGTAAAPGVSSSGAGTVSADATGAAAGLNVSPAAAPGPSALSAAAPASVPAASTDLTSASSAAAGLGTGTGTASIATGGGGGGGAGGGIPPTAGGGPTLGGYTQADGAAASALGATDASFPTPPVAPETIPNTNVASGVSPVTDASGNPVYASAGDAQTAAAQLGADKAGFPVDGSGTPASSGGMFGKVGDFLSGPNGKLAGVAISGAGLLKDTLSGNQDVAGASNISGLAKQASQQGSLLQSYLTSGTLPPAVQASVNAATKDGITAIKARYAQSGVAPGSSGELNDIARLQQNSVIQGATLADQLMQQGISESSLSGQLYNELVAHNTSLNNQTGAAITGLASALAGGGTKIQIGGSTTPAAT